MRSFYIVTVFVLVFTACKSQDLLKISIVRNRQTDTECSATDVPQHDVYLVYMDYTVTYRINKADYRNEDKRDSLLTNSEVYLDDAIAKHCDRILIRVEQIGHSQISETREYYIDIMTKQRNRIQALSKRDSLPE